MHYDFDIEIPAITPYEERIEHTLKLNYGVLRRVWIYFRGGCADLAHIQIWHWETQIFPTNLDGDFAFNDYVVEFEEYYPITEAPYELKVKVWNDDDTFAHTITLMFLVLHPSVVGTPEGRPTTAEELKALLGEYEIAGGG